MKYLALVFLGLFLLLSCFNTSIEGSYVKVKENDRGSDMNLLGLSLIERVNFGDKICRFDYAGTTMSGEYMIDGNFVYIEVGGELGTLTMEIIDKETLEGEGWISGTFKKK
jgi:hypothetical protein